MNYIQLRLVYFSTYKICMLQFAGTAHFQMQIVLHRVIEGKLFKIIVPIAAYVPHNLQAISPPKCTAPRQMQRDFAIRPQKKKRVDISINIPALVSSAVVLVNIFPPRLKYSKYFYFITTSEHEIRERL